MNTWYLRSCVLLGLAVSCRHYEKGGDSGLPEDPVSDDGAAGDAGASDGGGSDGGADDGGGDGGSDGGGDGGSDGGGADGGGDGGGDAGSDGGGDGGSGFSLDSDGDGVTEDEDCDDSDARLGRLLYDNPLDADDGYLNPSLLLTGPWTYDGGAVHTGRGGQQALLGSPETWTDTVTIVSLHANGALKHCDEGDCDETERFRMGVVARMNPDGDQDEGYSGYRCAVARNVPEDPYADGPFVQLSAFLDMQEDEWESEHDPEHPENPSFEQLAREERVDGQTSVLDGDQATLRLWAVGSQLVCEYEGVGGDSVSAKTTDTQFSAGGVALSTLNALGTFEDVRVCEALSAP